MDPPRRGGCCEAAKRVEKPGILEHEKDFGAPRSCSDSWLWSHAACCHPRGSVSLDSQSPSTPCESSSLATAQNDGGGQSHASKRLFSPMYLFSGIVGWILKERFMNSDTSFELYLIIYKNRISMITHVLHCRNSILCHWSNFFLYLKWGIKVWTP